MDISMDIGIKSVDKDMDGKFHIHSKPECHITTHKKQNRTLANREN